jgi:hypothetical protein
MAISATLSRKQHGVEAVRQQAGYEWHSHKQHGALLPVGC